MKKIILLPMFLATFGLARQVIVDNHTFVNVDEINPIAESNGILQTDYSMLKFNLNIHNSENRTKKIRIAGKFSGLDAQKKYYISGCDINKVSGIDAMVNFYESSRIGQRVLDVMLDVPQGDKNLCLALRENNWGPVVKGIVSIDWKGSADGNLLDYVTGSSPIDNKIAYNYIDKRLQTDMQEYGQLKKLVPNERFSAKVWYDDKTEDLTEKERFESENLSGFTKVQAKSLVDLHIGSFGAYKDTRMLMASLGSRIDMYRWNESTFDGHVSLYQGNEERMFSMGRCWAIGVFNIYSYFFGNRNSIDKALTQDEMVFYGKVVLAKNDPKYGLFIPNHSEGEYDPVSAKLMNWAIPGANAKVFTYNKNPIGGPEIEAFIKEGADGKGKPLFFSIYGKDNEPGHVMVIDGIAVTDDANQDTLVHLINIDNFGNEAYVYLNSLKKLLEGYVTYDKPNDFRESDQDHPVDVDSDEDGVVDFDEEYRFGETDYEKVYNTTILLPVKKELKNSGFEINYKFKPSTDHITFYAFDYLSVNDNVSCYGIAGWDPDMLWGDDNDYEGCNIVSEGSSQSNSLIIGVNTFVANVFSKGTVNVRNKAKLIGTHLYALDKSKYKVNYQDNQDANAPVVYHDPATWPFGVDESLESISDKIGNGQKIVKNGETFTISSESGHNGFSLLKVESGGTLVIGTGEMYIGDIQLESGSFFKFEHPAFRSELHLNGNFIWRGVYKEYDGSSVIRDDLDYTTARGFKLIQHSNSEMYVDSEWHGFIYAPYSKVILGQTARSKKIFGQVVGRHIAVHQQSKVYHVAYAPESPELLAKRASDPIGVENEIASVAKAPSNVKITSVNRNSIDFTASTSGVFRVAVMKLDGTIISSFSLKNDVAGLMSVDWNSQNVPNGVYMFSVKHDGNVSAKMFTLK